MDKGKSFAEMTPEEAAQARTASGGDMPAGNGLAPVTVGGQVFDTGQRSSAYIAFLRQLGLQEDQARQAAEVQKSEISRRLTMRTPQIADAYNKSRQNLSASLEGRGVLRSGETDRRMADSQKEEQAALGDAQTTAAEGISAVDRSTANQVGALRTQAAEKEQSDIQQQNTSKIQADSEVARAKAEQDARDQEFERNKELLKTQMDAQQKQYEAQLAAVRGASTTVAG